MAVGDPLIDEQHRTLIQQLNRLVEAMVAGRGRQEVESSLDFLAQYVTDHFGYEEACTERQRCPVAGKNKEAHTRFVESFRQLRAKIRADGPSPALAIEVRRQLSDWLVNHIRKVDTQLGGCMSHKVKVTNGRAVAV
jgi:hemerythrin